MKQFGSLWRFLGGGNGLDLKVGSFVPALVMLFGIFGLMIYAIPRHKSMYSVWLVIYLIINTAMSWPISLPRYLAAAVPIYIILGEICEKHKKVDTAVTVCFSILFGVFLTGYLMHRNIV